MCHRISVFLFLLFFSFASHAVTVNFTGVMDGFNAAPFSGGMAFYGSFNLDESVIAEGANNTFNGAVDNFELIIDGNTFNGENGNLQQFSSANGATDFFSVSISRGAIDGSVSGSVGTDIFTSAYFDFRGANLFSDPTILANNLNISAFSYTRVVFGFNDLGSSTVIDNNVTNFNVGSLTAVPLPAAVWLFSVGFITLIGFARGKSRF